LIKAAQDTGHLRGDSPVAATAQAVRDRRELAFVAVERTRMPMVVTDPRLADNPIVLANRAFLDSTGYPAEEVIGYNCRFLQGPETNPASIAKIRSAVQSEQVLTIELLNYRKNGSQFWNQLHINPIHDDQGKLQYYFASQLDITEQRRIEDMEVAERLLLKEIEHRARNALALVQGIVRLSRADSIEEFSARVQGRVDALAKAHTILSEARWRAVPLDRLIRAEIAAIGGQRVKLNGPEIAIAADRVQPLALVLHEMIANAARHGALSAASGTVSIHWRTEEDTMVIELNESGGPAPANDRAPGFGTMIVDAIMRRQLQGSAKFDWHPEGLRSVLKMAARAG